MIQSKNKPLLLGSGQIFQICIFALSPKIQTNLRPQKFLISAPSKLHFEVLGVGKIQEVFDLQKKLK